MKYYCSEKETVLQSLETTEKGLTTEEARRRLEKNGKNRLKAEKGKPLILRFFEQMADPMILILMAAAAISRGVICITSSRARFSTAGPTSPFSLCRT